MLIAAVSIGLGLGSTAEDVTVRDRSDHSHAVCRIWDPREFGAAADGQTLDTAAIQAAIDACANAGGGTVQLRGGTFKSGTIVLRSGITLEISAQTTLLGSERADDYMDIVPAVNFLYRGRFNKCLIYAERAQDIALVGAGTIDGQGKMFQAKKGDDFARPYLLRFSECRNVRVTGLTLRDSGRWVSHYLVCTNVEIRGIRIESRIRENRDGIDVDSCEDVRITGCDVFTGDDAVVLKATAGLPCRRVTVSGCRLSSWAAALKLGTESQGGFEDILFRDCVVHDTHGDGISILMVDGGVCQRVVVSNIVMRDVGVPIFIRLGNRAKPIPGHPKPGVGKLRGVVIRDIEVTGAGNIGCSITGIPGYPVENARLENIRIRFAGGGTAEDARRCPPELEGSYPKGSMFGRLPAWGLFCRHVDGLILRGLEFTLERPDMRPWLVTMNVTRYQGPEAVSFPIAEALPTDRTGSGLSAP